jgi:N-dimethylarginine dimethylaminohydrolase
MYGRNKVLVGGEIGRHFGRWLTERYNTTSSDSNRYIIAHVPDEAAANCIIVNGTLIRRTAHEFPDSHAVLSSLGVRQVEVECSELGKVDGALTCCALLY